MCVGVAGIAIGHVYFFLEDVYPKPKHEGGLGGPRILQTPAFLYVSLGFNRLLSLSISTSEAFEVSSVIVH